MSFQAKAGARYPVEQQAIDRIRANPYFRGRNLGIRLECQNDVLVVHGRVPSFYLKQQLQTVLKEVDGIRQVDNRVDVVCGHGLSSVKPTTNTVHI